MGTWAKWELLLFLGAIAATMLPLVVGPRRCRASLLACAGCAGLAALVSLVVVGSGASRRHRSNVEMVSAVPDLDFRESGFVSSNACRACHPANYDSWHASFHRTMTQVATEGSVLGDFDGVALESRGRTYALERRGDEFWVDMVDPDWEHDLVAEGVSPNTRENPPRVARRVVMTTGSHHMQTYWAGSARDGRLFNLPFVWLNEDGRWAPREDVFLRPPHFSRGFSTWHDNCVECHAVGGAEDIVLGLGPTGPRVAELGIACEACHGPGETHVRANHDPLRRYRYRLSGDPDPTIVNPSRLPAPASSQVCGQCHGLNLFKGDVIGEGVRYLAGGDLTESRMILRTSDRHMRADERDDWPRMQEHIAAQRPSYMESRFWPDGMVRVSGREHNAITESACFEHDTLSCLSCHSMHHHTGPNDQLSPAMNGDAACLQCHDAALASARHTHHAAGSEGSRCYNCHMPHTTYGLMKAIRSHLIDSPSVAVDVEVGRPNACNLCHLDKSLRWTADALVEWYGQPDVQLDDDQESISAALLWLLSGDANQRALLAWHMGWEPALEASGRDWQVPFLARLLNDPYSCVRYIAHRALRLRPGLEDFEYDFVGPALHRAASVKRATDAWHARPDRNADEILTRADGTIDRDTVGRLLATRNDRDVDLRE